MVPTDDTHDTVIRLETQFASCTTRCEDHRRETVKRLDDHAERIRLLEIKVFGAAAAGAILGSTLIPLVEWLAKF